MSNTDTDYKRSGKAAQMAEESVEPTSATSLPLHGLHVIEMHAIGPVPYAGMQLLQLGASVLRISPPTDPRTGIPVDTPFDLLNAEKDTQILNLKLASDLEVMWQLLGSADVLLEGFRPGVLERLQLGPDVLANRFPQLVLGRLSGYGYHGELAKRAGHDINYLALSGVLHAIGTSTQPTIPLNLIGDFGGGAMHLLLGVMAKLIQRSITGIGGVAQTSILAGTLGLTPMIYGLLAADQWSLMRQQNLLDGGAPFYRLYATSDKQFVAVGALESKFFTQLLKLTQLENRISPAQQYCTSTWPDMTRLLATAFLSHTRDEWATLAKKLDCCVSPVLNFLEASESAHSDDNRWFVQNPYAHPGKMISFG